ncbi:hypothetical protein [Phytoactinopolyspora mesophila]|uniref:Uncharacterized protein n=1 Tax=Phytoactinopolyspora mesophila TaxID=2650750 RepID=A0A7K3MBZ8_9ACTN|nr:hypothetical protein [Phytoactinopolyspora mesophila]NDL60796.1 hypothetical protein [Phytoactinopolyspora mesophila]
MTHFHDYQRLHRERTRDLHDAGLRHIAAEKRRLERRLLRRERRRARLAAKLVELARACRA